MSNPFKLTTNNFHKCFSTLFFLVFIFVVLLFALMGFRKLDLAFNPNAKRHYLAAIIDKMSLVDSIKTPRLILAGGNGMAFGVDGELLSKELEMPVINLALDSNLGSDFMLNQLESCAKKGDVVVIALDYNTTSGGSNETKLLVSELYTPASKWIEYQSFIESITCLITQRFSFKNLFLGDLDDNKNQDIQDTTSVFFRQAFNKRGDLVSHLNNPKVNFTPTKLSVNTDFNQQIIKLNEVDSLAKKKAIKMFFTFSSYSESGFEKNMITIEKIEKQLSEKAKFTILGNAQNSVLDNTFFFNNEYNLNMEGRKIFTSRILQLLEQEDI